MSQVWMHIVSCLKPQLLLDKNKSIMIFCMVRLLLQFVQYSCITIPFFILVYNMMKKSLKMPKGGNQNPYIEEEQTTQWPKEIVQKGKQRLTKQN